MDGLSRGQTPFLTPYWSSSKEGASLTELREARAHGHGARGPELFLLSPAVTLQHGVGAGDFFVLETWQCARAVRAGSLFWQAFRQCWNTGLSIFQPLSGPSRVDQFSD